MASGVSQAGRLLLSLINDILDLSKIEAGKLELEIVDFDVREVVDRATALMIEPARCRSVDLVVACGVDVPHTLRGDPVRFGQIVTNLVSNAVKFTQDGQVTLRVGTDRSQMDAPVLRVEVVDTGIGIPLDVQPRLFDSFTQADASTTREYGGTGLGLTICRRLVEALGGEIGLVSEVGVGSTFWFTTTLEEPSEEHRSIAAAPIAATESSPPTATNPGQGVVLVAEDNALNQQVARGMLEGLGYEVEFAHDGREAVTAVTSSPGRFVAVLMDCQMPRLDGYAATQAIRQQEEPGARLPIIAMTASVVLGEEDRCIAAGMDDFVVKPVDFEVLGETLSRWIPAATATGSATEIQLAQTGVLDLARIRMLQELRPVGRSFVDQFVETFVGRVPQDLDAIRSAVRDRDDVRLSSAAHLLKGSAQNLGASEVGRVAHELEAAGLSRDLSEADDLLRTLEEQVTLAVDALLALEVTGPSTPSLAG